MAVADGGDAAPEPFIVEGKVWYYEHTDTRSTYIYKVYFEGDTLMDNQQCKKMVIERPGAAPYYGGACYEDGGKVWMYYTTYSDKAPQKWLLYDFTCMEGDTLTGLVTYQNAEFVVSEVSTVRSFGKERRRIALIPVQNSAQAPGYWLEGIGSRFHISALWPVIGASERFYSCELDGEVIADQSSFGDAALQTAGMEEEIMVEKLPQGNFYNLQGIHMKSLPSKGVYIQKDKKHLK